MMTEQGRLLALQIGSQFHDHGHPRLAVGSQLCHSGMPGKAERRLPAQLR
jgi:hypothetical protein